MVSAPKAFCPKKTDKIRYVQAKKVNDVAEIVPDRLAVIYNLTCIRTLYTEFYC